MNNHLLVVTSEGEEILRLNDFPASDLRRQIKSWLGSVTEETAKSFIFKSSEPDKVGIFRIEPRANGWQFTSHKETRRAKEILSLQEWREVLSNVL